MNLLNIFKTKPQPDALPSNDDPNYDVKHSDKAADIKPTDNIKSESPDVPENIFIEYAKPTPKGNMEPNDAKPEASDLQTLYQYLQQNLDKKGYEDALINPDSSYMDEQIIYISNELSLLISKIKTYYAGYMRTIDFHIDTRKRNGMIETVDELLTHKETVLEEMKIVSSIESDLSKGTGLSQNPILSYKKGFRNGFAAITYNTVLSRKN